MNWNLSSYTLLLIGVILPAQVFAAPTSLRDLVVLGVEQNIGLQVERLNVPVAAENVVINEAIFDAELFSTLAYSDSSTPVATSSLAPVVTSDSEVWSGAIGTRKKYHSGLLASLSLSSEWTEDNGITDDLNPDYRTGLNLNLSQPLLRDFGRQINTINLQVARNQQSQSSLQLLLEAQSLALQIEFLASQLAGEAAIVDLRAEAVTLAKDLYSANKRRFDTGVIPVSEVQEAETELANRELGLSLAYQAKELSFEILNRQLNQLLPGDFDTGSFYLFDSELDRQELPKFERLFSAAREKNVILYLQTIDIDISELQQNYYLNQLKPQLDLNLHAGLNGYAGDERSSSVQSTYSGSWADSLGSTVELDGFQWGAGLEFSMPLGNRSAKSRLRQADLQKRQARYRKKDAEAALKGELAQQTITLRRAYDQVKIAERFVTLAELSLAQEQRRLEEGLSDTFRVISFQDNMISAKIGRITALIRYYANFAQLSFSRGIILEQHNIQLPQDFEESSLERR